MEQRRKRKATQQMAKNDSQIEKWLENEEEEDFSDFDDTSADQDYVVEDDIHEESEISAGEAENDEVTGESTRSIVSETESTLNQHCYRGKNGFAWSKTDMARTSRAPARNFVSLPRPNENQLQFPGYEKLWEKYFDSEMIERLVTCTNKKLESYRQRFSNYAKQELKATDEIEIRSLLGVLYYSSVFKCNDADSNYLFVTDGTGHEIFRCVLSRYRFNTLINCLRTDDIDDRQERLTTDSLAAMSFFFDKFNENCQSHYTPGPYTCIDEMLLAFKGRCKFIVYMPNKPAKYVIKILLLVDAETYYVYNAYIYFGKGADGFGLTEAEKKMAVPTQSVLRLVKPIENTNPGSVLYP